MKSFRNSVVTDMHHITFEDVYVDKNENLLPHADFLESDVRQVVRNRIARVVRDDLVERADQETQKGTDQ